MEKPVENHASQGKSAPSPSPTESITVNVWPGLAPGEHTSETGRVTPDQSNNVIRLTDVTCPQLHLFRPDNIASRPAVLVCPGGGYQILAVNLEGAEVAQWLNSLGIVAAVLYYRVPGKREAAFQDVQRSLSVLRSRAKEFGIDPAHLGVLGFSAGGHLSARLACGFSKRAYETVDAADQVSCRPDFALLIYPAYLIDKATGEPEPEVQPHADTPSMFLTQTRDDPYFSVEAYSKALEGAGVKSRCVVYEKGGHGYGLRLPSDQPVHAWKEESASWLRQQVSLVNPPAVEPS